MEIWKDKNNQTAAIISLKNFFVKKNQQKNSPQKNSFKGNFFVYK